jgi:hypothetical protein
MTPSEYLNSVLEAQTLKDDSQELKDLQTERQKVEKLLREAFSGGELTVRYGGSKAKGTLIRDAYDLDILCYLANGDNSGGETLEDIYNNAKKALEKDYYVTPKRSALRISNKEKVDFHIDVVAGRFSDDSKTDAFLFQAEGEKKALKTNPDKHISHVKNSGLLGTIKLLKLWKYRAGLDVKTFVLELLIIEALEKVTDEKGLDKCLIAMWAKLAEKIGDIKIEDPANPTGNDLSGMFDDALKLKLSIAAKQALAKVKDNKWGEIFGTPVAPADRARVVANVSDKLKASGPKPWFPH